MADDDLNIAENFNATEGVNNSEVVDSEQLDTSTDSTAEQNLQDVDTSSDDSEKDELSEDDKLLSEIALAVEEKEESLPKNVQKKINRETAARKQAQEELLRLQQENARLIALGVGKSNDDYSVNVNFDDEDLTVQESVKRALAAEKQKIAQEEQFKRQTEYLNNLSNLAAEKADKARSIFPDYDDVVSPLNEKLGSNPALMLGIAKCDNMGKVLYYISKNAEYQKEILQTKDVMDIALKLGKLDNKLSQKPVTKKVSSAAKPVEKSGATAGHGSSSPDVLSMNAKQFDAYLKSLK